MASVYPNNPDAFNRTTPSDPLTGHSDLHDDISDAVENIQAFVGVSGDTTTGTVVKRIADLEQKDITLTLDGDVSGSATITNLGNATITATVADDSHNHTISNVDDLQTTLNGKAASSHSHSYAATSHTHSYAATSHTHSYAATSHSHSYAATSHGHTNMITGKRGNGSFYVDGNGYATITHSLGSTPVAAFVQTRSQQSTGAGGGETVISLPITSMSSSTLTFRAYENDSGSGNSSGYVSTIFDSSPGDTFINVSWLVLT